MKKMISISQMMDKKLKTIAVEQGATQSSIVETALSIYFLIYLGDKKQANKINDMMIEARNSGQLDLIDELFKDK